MSKKTANPKVPAHDKDLSSAEHDRILLWLHEAILTNVLGWMHIEHGWPKNTVNDAKVEIEKKRQERILELRYILGDKEVAFDLGKFHARSAWERDQEDMSKAKAVKKATKELEVLQREDFHLEIAELPVYPEIPVARVWQHRHTVEEAGPGRRTVTRTLGFIDLVASFSMPNIALNTPSEIATHKEPIGWWHPNDTAYELWFDVRAEIPNIGLLLREIGLLEIPKRVTYFVVSRDDRFRDIVEHHGYRFLHAPPADQHP